jgi:hypothetical protein
MGAIVNTYRIFVRISEGKRPLGRHRRRWEDSIKMNLKDNGRVWTGFVWVTIGSIGGLL